MQATKVGIREFRENLAAYLEAKGPVAITRHGATIGIFTPTRRRVPTEKLEAFLATGDRIDAMVASAGTNEEELMVEFKKLRKENSKRKI